MKKGYVFKVMALFIGDVVALYAALFIALLVRYGGGFYRQFVGSHIVPFTVVFVPCILIFYTAGLYDLRRLRNNLDFMKTLALALVVDATIAILFFYFIPAFGIAPKTNLFIFFIIFAIIGIIWRRAFNRITTSGEAPNNVLFVGDGREAEEIGQVIRENPQLGYEIIMSVKESSISNRPELLEETARAKGANIIVVPRHLKRENRFASVLYRLFGNGIFIIDIADFYELIMRKIPLTGLEEAWFFENIERTARFYDPMKSAGEFILALVLGIVLLPFEALIGIIIKLTSRGPIFIRQKRVGRLGAEFTLYKFRSMIALAPDGQAEIQGAQWSAKDDTRITPFGKFLRATHLDELPQLWNIAQGKLSFVGPRPERPEFVATLKEKIPYYEMRLLVKPGVTGWAQINYRADLTLDDVAQKLQYDIYYLKNRSLILDLAIVLKTIKSLFVNPE
jgi:exopolysaccharide biosynthesis polyprenyl glycosylphosphotransferase